MRLPTLVALLTLLLAGCAGDASDGGGEALEVVTTVAPVTELTERIGGHRVEVRSVAAAGGDAHDLELSTNDVDAIEDADLVLYVGGGFQPAVERVADRAKRAVDVLVGRDSDPHFWLDPLSLADAVRLIVAGLREIDPAGEPEYLARSRQVTEELEALHGEIDQGLDQCQRRLIVTSHRAFARFAERYRLEQEAIADHSAEEEPDAARVAEVADLVRARGVTTVFGEPGADRDLAAAVAREAGVATAVLDPAERSQTGYSSVMRSNLQVLRTALDCR